MTMVDRPKLRHGISSGTQQPRHGTPPPQPVTTLRHPKKDDGYLVPSPASSGSVPYTSTSGMTQYQYVNTTNGYASGQHHNDKNRSVLLLSLLLFALVCVIFAVARRELKVHDQALLDTIRQYEWNVLDYTGQVSHLEQDKKYLEKRLRDAQAAQTTVEASYKTLRASDQSLHEHLTSLQTERRQLKVAIQKLSRQQVLAQFGPGPHFVEMHLAYDPDSNVAQQLPNYHDYERIVIQLAPLDDMPHSILWFLQQVLHKLYDDCSFHRNADHILQAGPVTYYDNTDQSHAQRFHAVEQGLYESVLFQEYSNNFPHVPMTIGYSGRPGGPDWYINVRDNTEAHGPGGQAQQYPENAAADPCFARVVESSEAAVRVMQRSATHTSDSFGHMIHSVRIVSMNIVPPEDVT